MNEQDRKIVESAKGGEVAMTRDELIRELVAIIDRLDQQLAEVKEAGEPIEIFISRFGSDTPDDYVISVAGVHHTLGSVCLVLGKLRRLTQVLRKMER